MCSIDRDFFTTQHDEEGGRVVNSEEEKKEKKEKNKKKMHSTTETVVCWKRCLAKAIIRNDFRKWGRKEEDSGTKRVK